VNWDIRFSLKVLYFLYSIITNDSNIINLLRLRFSSKSYTHFKEPRSNTLQKQLIRVRFSSKSYYTCRYQTVKETKKDNQSSVQILPQSPILVRYSQVTQYNTWRLLVLRFSLKVLYSWITDLTHYKNRQPNECQILLKVLYFGYQQTVNHYNK
jgi:hypothetical protein